MDIRFYAVKEATDNARVAMEKRLDGMNEFRSALKDQAVQFVNKDEYAARGTQYGADIARLRDQISGTVTQTTFKATLAQRDEINKRNTDDIKSLLLSRAELEGKATQTQALIAMAMGLVGTLLSGISIFVSIVRRSRNNNQYRATDSIDKQRSA